MKVTIHISHNEADDLAGVQSTARGLGLEVVTRGGFMGKHHTEIAGDVSPAGLEQMLAVAAPTSVAA